MSINRREASAPYASGPTTAIAKGVPAGALVEFAIPGRSLGLGSGVVGDEIGDPRHHGGRLTGGLCLRPEDQQWWAEQIGRPIAPALRREPHHRGRRD